MLWTLSLFCSWSHWRIWKFRRFILIRTHHKKQLSLFPHLTNKTRRKNQLVDTKSSKTKNLWRKSQTLDPQSIEMKLMMKPASLWNHMHMAVKTGSILLGQKRLQLLCLVSITGAGLWKIITRKPKLSNPEKSLCKLWRDNLLLLKLN